MHERGNNNMKGQGAGTGTGTCTGTSAALPQGHNHALMLPWQRHNNTLTLHAPLCHQGAFWEVMDALTGHHGTDMLPQPLDPPQ